MPKEIITINLGQAGCKIGEAVVRQYVSESIGGENEESKIGFNNCFFEEIDADKDEWKARVLFADSDPTAIEELMVSEDMKQYFPLEDMDQFKLLNNSAGTYDVGYLALDRCDGLLTQKIISMMEKCDKLDGVVMNYGISGGTGSGLSIRLMDTGIFDNRDVLSFQVWPSNSFSSGPVSPLNSTFSLGKHINGDKAPGINIVVDNEALVDQLVRGGVANPSLRDINAMIALVHSSITIPFRSPTLDGGQGLAGFRNHVTSGPFNFVTAAYAPIVHSSGDVSNRSVDNLLSSVCNPDNCFVKYKVAGAPEVDPRMHAFQHVLFRGRGKVVNDKGKLRSLNGQMMKVAVQKAKSENICVMAKKRQWNAIGEGMRTVGTLPKESTFAHLSSEITMFANNPALSHVMKWRILNRALKIWETDMYRHHFSVVESEFAPCAEAIQSLIDKSEEISGVLPTE